jgi:transposase
MAGDELVHRSRACAAIAYMLGLWRGLTRPSKIRGLRWTTTPPSGRCAAWVVGRKNHYGSRPRRGTEVAALLYSLIESAKLCGVEPKAYLTTATRAALETPGAVTLPHALLTS